MLAKAKAMLDITSLALQIAAALLAGSVSLLLYLYSTQPNRKALPPGKSIALGLVLL